MVVAHMLLLLLSLLQPSLSVDTSNVTYCNISGAAHAMAFIAKEIYLLKINTAKSGVGLTASSYINLSPSNGTHYTCQGEAYATSSRLDLIYKGIGAKPVIESLSISLKFNLNRQYWDISEAKVSIKCGSDNESCQSVDNGTLVLPWLAGTSQYGYKCVHPPEALVVTKLEKLVDLHWGIRFSWLQVQPFGVKGGIFGPAVDCTRYFSIPIWGTLVVSFVVIGILTYGLQMILSIQPNPFFEDPKGKQVQLGGNA
ncbi:unnamed protein product [Calicophoron daubneyi]|uniref:V-type proton ATPase subunit S1/VOA1 transmembrane domain-containing protein n=1 Tax=Calicophoron daubneyi TaxID=300641 RepID=A0AAV2TYV2_CALDB